MRVQPKTQGISNLTKPKEAFLSSVYKNLATTKYTCYAESNAGCGINILKNEIFDGSPILGLKTIKASKNLFAELNPKSLNQLMLKCKKIKSDCEYFTDSDLLFEKLETIKQKTLLYCDPNGLLNSDITPLLKNNNIDFVLHINEAVNCRCEVKKTTKKWKLISYLWDKFSTLDRWSKLDVDATDKRNRWIWLLGLHESKNLSNLGLTNSLAIYLKAKI